MSGHEMAVTKEEVEAFSSRLEQWGATLSPKERALLDVLVKLAGKGLPVGSELPDDQLESVAGGGDLHQGGVSYYVSNTLCSLGSSWSSAGGGGHGVVIRGTY